MPHSRRSGFAALAALSLIVGCSQDSDPADSPETTTDAVSQSPWPQDLRLTQAPRQLPPERLAEGWVQMFDGRTTFGWSDPDNGLLVRDGLLMAEKKQSATFFTPLINFEIELEYQRKTTGTPRLLFESAENSSRKLTIDLPPTADGETATLRIQMTGNELKLTAAGDVTTQEIDPVPQTLTLTSESGDWSISRLWLRMLEPQSITFDKELSNWRRVPGSKGNFVTSEDGSLRVTGGRGFIETTEQFDDFALRFDFRTNGDALNSGLFFRAQAGTEDAPSNGYEFQIHNGIHESRDQPLDTGTGGIFRRMQARWVAAEDREWTHCLLIASGRRMMTWVNGVPVCQWEDDRTADLNPREGYRQEAGHFSLQAHDPTTDIEFRNFAVTPFR